jgi:omega-6 fatty acid desaturase (delta-12 desaturase)
LSRPPSPVPGADWRRAVEPYIGPNTRRASFQLITTLVPLAAAGWCLHLLWQRSFVLALPLVLIVAGLLVRTFVLMHDCAHGSFIQSRRVNDIVGFFTGVLTLTPFAQWRRDHALHHASSGDLDRRGHGDVPTLTVREYLALPPRRRLAYRITRHPAALLLIGPLHLAIGQRFRSAGTATGRRQIASVWATNAAIVLFLVAGLWVLGWQSVLVAYALPYYVAASMGVWLFYVQHQFEEAYWAPHEEWSYVEASLRGSSHLQLAAPLRWITGDIGLHHVHHIAPKIPNYRLQACHDANPIFGSSPKITIRSGNAALRLTLWDEDQRRLVAFRDVSLT